MYLSATMQGPATTEIHRVPMKIGKMQMHTLSQKSYVTVCGHKDAKLLSESKVVLSIEELL